VPATVVDSEEGLRKATAPQLRAALKLQPSLAKTQALLGMCEKLTGDIVRAEADLKASLPRLQEEKLKVQTGMELIELYYGAGELEKAAGVIALLRQLKPADPEILYTAYRIYSTLTDEAMLAVATAATQNFTAVITPPELVSATTFGSASNARSAAKGCAPLSLGEKLLSHARSERAATSAKSAQTD